MKPGTEKAANAVFAKALKGVKPSNEELQKSVNNINQIMGRLKKVVPREVEIRVVGSVVRGTHLRGDSDVDIFLLFSKKHSRDKITKDGLAYAKKILAGKGERFELKYAAHPYARLYLDSIGVRVDVVPAFNIDNIEDMGTAVDRSPMHADFINKQLSEKQRDDVRVLKVLLKAQGIYGAEVKTSGFSGYLCELLVHQHGSLLKLLESTCNFTLPVLMDPGKKAMTQDPALVKKFNSKFVVIDPVDPNRNVAAGVSMESLARFVMLARRFTAKPSPAFFAARKDSPAKAGKLLVDFLKGSGLDMFVLTLNVPDKSEDVIWPQLRKVSGIVTDKIERYGFHVYLSVPLISGGKGLLAFFMPKEMLETRLLKGPSVFIRKAQEEFVRAHQGAAGMLVQDDVLYALDKNRYASAEELMRGVVTGKVLGAHKDVKIVGAKLLVNKVPGGYASDIYAALMRKVNL